MSFWLFRLKVLNIPFSLRRRCLCLDNGGAGFTNNIIIFQSELEPLLIDIPRMPWRLVNM